MPAVLRGLPVAARVGLFVLCYLVLRHAAVLGSQLLFGRVPPVAAGVPVWVFWGAIAGGPPLVLAGLCALFVRDREKRLPILCWMIGAGALVAFCRVLFALGLQHLSPNISGTISFAHMALIGLITGSFLALGIGAPEKAVATGALFGLLYGFVIPMTVYVYSITLPHPIAHNLLQGALLALCVALALEYFQRRESLAPLSRDLAGSTTFD